MSLGGQALMHSTYMDSPSGRAPLSGVHPGMFRPPTSPSISGSTYRERPSIASGADSFFANPTPKRKRNTATSIDLSSQWGLGIDNAVQAPQIMTPAQAGRRKISRGNSRYTLAGEIATPGIEVQKRLSESLDDSIYSDTDYRRDGGSRRSQEEDDDEEDELGAPLSRYTTAESRPDASTTQANGWGAFAFNTIGGVVGKVWNFCKGGAFRGFHAGGGQGFQISAPTMTAPKGQVWCNEHDVPTLPSHNISNTPGAFPGTSHALEPRYESDTPDSTPRPTAKRRQISGTIPGEELRRNWVMVSEDDNKSSRTQLGQQTSASLAVQPPPPPPFRPSIGGRRISRPISRIQTTPSHPRRQSSRASLGGNTNASTASFASTRSPVRDLEPPSRIPVRSQSPLHSPSRSLSQQSSSQFARIPSPSPYSHRRSQSAASSAAAVSGATPGSAGRLVKKRESMSEVSENSPRLDKQARKLAAKRQQEERQNDLRINDFNARLQEMIRQGKEALGTTIEVDLDEDDGQGDVGGWEDD